MIEHPRQAAGPRVREDQALRRVEELFSAAGWRVKREPPVSGADLLVRRGRYSYAVEVKLAVEPRRDRLLPLLALAILNAQALSRRSSGASPLAILVAPRLPERVIKELLEYAASVAPNSAVGVMDLEGRVELRGPGLEELKAIPSGAPLLWSAVLPRQPFDMFSDLNQWMLKVLLAPRVPLPLLSAPRASISGAASLAAAAHVSAPSAFRLLRHLAQNKWLEEVAPLRLVRVPELLRRWRAASQRPPHEIRMRWLIPGHPDQLRLALRRYHLKRHRSAEPNALSDSPADALPRACLGLYSAANALGLGHVRGVADYLYVERLAPPVFDALGLSNAEPGDRVDVVVRLPRWPRALFRAAVEQDGVLVSDVIQVWLDVQNILLGGQSRQTRFWRRVLEAVADEGAVR